MNKKEKKRKTYSFHLAKDTMKAINIFIAHNDDYKFIYEVMEEAVEDFLKKKEEDNDD